MIRHWQVTGQVQGVGFRPFVFRLAASMGIGGSVRNDPAGVRIRASGEPASLDRFRERLLTEAPPLARIDSLTLLSEGAGGETGFAIEASDEGSAERGRVTVDSAVCAECLAEMRDPADRRHGHGLVNCVSCGPRYTIVRDLPYDRPRTTMAGFAMCPACAAEYEDPADRRYHAQPVCCPECGPQVTLEGGDDAVAILAGGGVLAVKGLGGYHLAVDARNEEAVRRLRHLKGRDEKPFAVMVADLDAARSLARLSPAAAALLTAPESPVVLAPARGSAIAPSVSKGAHRIGLMLANTPLQHLLFDAGAGPLVMTSCNRSDDPLITEDGAAGSMADAVLRHDRPIERAVDDSVVIDGPRGIVPVRRARGFVPAPIGLPIPAARPGLCAGGDLKSTVAVARGAEAVLSQHIGDLAHALALRRFETAIADLTRLFEVEPEWVACDAHPGYLSHRHARRLGLPIEVVQHHHAHLAALLAEHGLSGPVVGLVCDGTGYGEDGTIWGGEVLVGDLRGFRRLGRLRPLRLPGGDAAAVETTRCAAGWRFDAGLPAGGDPVIAEMLARDVSCPRSSGLGRLFDAAAALLGVVGRNDYEARSGLMLEAAASRSGDRPSGEGVIPIADGEPFELDHRPLCHMLDARTAAGEPVEDSAWLFHDAVADALARAAARAAEAAALDVVGLSGGVFLNTLLARQVAERLEAAKLTVLAHRVVPPGDGGLSLGQAAVAAARGR